MKRRLSLLALLLTMLTAAMADGPMETQIFDPRFRTLRIEKPGDFMAMPVLALNGHDSLVVSFDELGEDFSRLQYRLLHCNADWTPSRLMESEYVDGFNVADIEDYAFSSNTYVHFVNYRFEIPSQGMTPLTSGNYLVQVFPQDDPDTTLLQVRFYVTEQGAAISGKATGRTDRGINTTWQQLELGISTDPQTVSNPYTDLIVTVMQNARPETMRTLTRPMQALGNRLEYRNTDDLIFPAGNEYRRFETVRNNYPGMGVDSTRYSGNNYHAWLVPSASRRDGSYLYDRTQRGRYVIDEYNSTDPTLGADYITVHFTLDYPELMDADIYVEGDLNMRRFDDANRMVYNRATGLYELQMTLKQGSYNFQYVARGRDGDNRTDASMIEGDFAETANEYDVCVYLRTPASRGDRLLGTATILSSQ